VSHKGRESAQNGKIFTKDFSIRENLLYYIFRVERYFNQVFELKMLRLLTKVFHLIITCTTVRTPPCFDFLVQPSTFIVGITTTKIEL